MAIAGKVAITPGYEWSASVAYDKLVVVTYNNNVYLSTKANTGIEPTNEEYWMLLIENVTAEDLEELQTTVESILNGTTSVGDSKLLEGLTAKEVCASGARNLCSYPYKETTKTSNGITFTDNGDGSIACGGILASGSNYGYFRLAQKDRILKAGTYIASLYVDSFSQLNPYKEILNWQFNCWSVSSGGVDNTVSMTIVDKTRIFTINEDCYLDSFISSKETNGRTYTVYPMLEPGSVAHDYVPYHFGGAKDADTVNGVKLYKSFSEIGSNISKNTPIKDVVSAMAVNSRLVVTVYNPADGIYPITNGVLEINKTYSSEHTSLKFTAHTGKGFWHGLAQTNGNYWTGWIKSANADEVLHLTGGTVSGDLKLDNGTNVARLQAYRTASDGTKTRAEFGNSNGVINISMYGASNALLSSLLIKTNEIQYKQGEVTNTILHTGNSNAVIKATTAPSNTTAVWVDTANKKVKAYIDGAWTVIA